jgi:hypothetical protein
MTSAQRRGVGESKVENKAGQSSPAQEQGAVSGAIL